MVDLIEFDQMVISCDSNGLMRAIVNQVIGHADTDSADIDV